MRHRSEPGGHSGLRPEGSQLHAQDGTVDLLQPRLGQREPHGVEARGQALLQSERGDQGGQIAVQEAQRRLLAMRLPAPALRALRPPPGSTDARGQVGTVVARLCSFGCSGTAHAGNTASLKPSGGMKFNNYNLASLLLWAQTKQYPAKART